MSVRNKAMIWFSKYRQLIPFVVAQVRHETNDFKSTVYLIDHNMFGMKWINGARGQVATKGILSPEGNYYAHYEDDAASLADFLKWLDYEKFPTSVADAGQYAQELRKRGYFTASFSEYANALVKWLTT